MSNPHPTEMAMAAAGRKVRGGRLHVLTLTGITDPLGEDGDLVLWDTHFLSFRRVGNEKYRLRQFLTDTGPIHPSVDPKSGARTISQFVFSHIIVAIPRAVYQNDAYERNYEGINGLTQGLERLVRDAFGTRLWEPERGIRVRVVPHDLDADEVLIKVGRAVSLPAPDDRPVADVAVLHRATDGTERTVPLAGWHHFAGRPGHLDLIEQPIAVYPGDRYLLLSPHETLAPVVVGGAAAAFAGSDGEPVRFGIDLVRKIGLLEAGGVMTAKEVVPDTSRPGVLVFTFETAGRSPVPGGQPEAIVVSIRPRAGWQAQDREQEQEQDREADREAEAAPAPVLPVASPDRAAKAPFSPLSDFAAFRAVAPALGDGAGVEGEDEPTIVVGPRPGVATSLLALDVVGLALHALHPGGDARSWTLGFDADGGLSGLRTATPPVLEIGATAGRPGLWAARRGARDWERLRVPGTVALPDGPELGLSQVPAALADAYLGFIDLADVVTLTLPADRHVFGRAGGTADNKLAIGLLTRPGSLEAGDGTACLEQLGLSKDHVALAVDGDSRAVRAELLGRAPLWHLDAGRQVVAGLQPGDGGALVLALGDHLVAGPYLLRVREI